MVNFKDTNMFRTVKLCYHEGYHFTHMNEHRLLLKKTIQCVCSLFTYCTPLKGCIHKGAAGLSSESITLLLFICCDDPAPKKDNKLDLCVLWLNWLTLS